MATKLMKPLRRELLGLASTKKGRVCAIGDCGARPIIVEMSPPDTLTFRVKGTRIRYEITMATALATAHKQHIINTYNEKLKEYKTKKEAGMRVKKPKKPFMPYK